MIKYRCICRSEGVTFPVEEAVYKFYKYATVSSGRMKDEIKADTSSMARITCNFCNLQITSYSVERAETQWNTIQERKWAEFALATSNAIHEENKNWERKIRM